MFFKGWIMTLQYSFLKCVKSGSVPTLEGNATQLDGDYKNRTEPQRKCYEAANERGWLLFTISDGGACNSGPDALYTYAEKGLARCYMGKGGPNKAPAYIMHGK